MDEKKLASALENIYSKYSRTLLIRSFIRMFFFALIIVVLVSIPTDQPPNEDQGLSYDFDKHIAVIDVKDELGEGSLSDRQLLLLDRQNPANIAAIILRVESPGSAVTDAESFYNAIQYYQSLNIPVVASFGSIATSGAYLISSSADKIYSYRNSMVGSIGVILQYPQIKSLLDKVGVNHVTVRSGPLKASANPFESLSKETREELQRGVNRSASWFLNLVKTNRQLSPSVMKELSKGGVYNGDEALELGLVDELGEYYDALGWLYSNIVDRDTKVVTYYDYVVYSYGGYDAFDQFVKHYGQKFFTMLNSWQKFR